MPRWTKVSSVAAGALLAAGAAAVGIGRAAWSRGTERAVAQLRGGARSDPAGEPAPSPASLEALPPPVARYLAAALPRDRAGIRAATIRWSGEFRSRPDGPWAPFTAEQHFTTRPPGFVWDARIRMLPLLPVHVRDGYRGGTGTMLGRVGAVVPVVDEGGTPEMAQSALARWLGEAVWFPAALLPGGAVRWEAVDDATALATVRDGEVRASAEFHFAPTGEPTRMTAMRYRDVDGTPVLTPFEGRYGAYRQISGVLVPADAEVAWVLPEGRFAYWRGRPESIEYGAPSAPGAAP